MKICRKCKINKEKHEFGLDNSKKDKLASYCKPCNALKCKAWISADKNKAKAKNRTLLSLYKISLNEYETLYRSQRGLCKICELPESKYARLSVDHCHVTGKVRGLLCHKCNRGLGLFTDDAAKLYKAIAYLGE